MKHSPLRRGRELAVQMLYERELSGADVGQLLESIDGTWVPSEEAKGSAAEMVRGVVARITEIDEILSSVSENWAVGRMSVVDRSCLRLACYELMARKDVAFRIIIDEAIEVAKRYGEEKSGAFVNGILDAIARRLRPEEVAKIEPPSPSVRG